MHNRTLPCFELNLNGTPEIIDPNIDLQVNEGDLLTEFAEQPAKYAFYAGLYTDALSSLEEFKNALSIYEAENENVMRSRIHERYGEKERITKDMLASEFVRDSKWQELTHAIILWEKQVKRLEGTKEAFKQRAQMLWNIGATRRQEMVRMSPSQNESE